MTCSPFVALDINLMDNSLVLSEEAVMAFTNTNIGKVDSTTINLATSLVNSTIAAKISSGTLGDRPLLKERFLAYPFSSVEIAEFVVDSFYSEFNIVAILNSSSGGDVETLLDALESFVDSEMGAATAGGFCAAISNPLSKITGLLNKLSSLLGSISMIVPQIMAMKEMLHQMVDKLISRFTDKIKNIGESVKNFAGKAFAKALKKVNDVKALFSKENIANIKNNIDGIVKSMMSQFKDMTMTNIFSIVLRMCQMIESIKKIFQGPIDTVKMFMSSAQNLSLGHTNNTNGMVAEVNALGLSVMSYTDRYKAIQQVISSGNQSVSSSNIYRGNQNPTSSSGSDTTQPNNDSYSSYTGRYQPQFNGYIALPQMSIEERGWTFHLDILNAADDENIMCLEGVTQMGKRATGWYNSASADFKATYGQYWNPNENRHSDENLTDDGLEKLKENELFPLVKLRRVARTIKRRLFVNSGFRSNFYQAHLYAGDPANVAKPGSSEHNTGSALDLGFTVKDDFILAQYVEMLSREGFTRIASYPTFFHVDHLQQNTWPKSMPAAGLRNVGPLVADAMALHRCGAFRKGGVVPSGTPTEGQQLSRAQLEADPAFQAKLAEMQAKYPGLSKEQIYNTIQGESGFNTNPDQNKAYAGLFQFSGDSAARVGTTVPAIQSMNATQQLQVYDDYLASWGYQGGSLGIMQAAPAYADKPTNYEVYKYSTDPKSAYVRNPGWRGADGRITVGSINSYYDNQ